jgi:hypothetical protein
MDNVRLRLMGAWCVSVLALSPIGAGAAEGDQLLATVDKPAVVVATPAPLPASAAATRPSRIIVSVTGYRPSQDGSPVAVVVKAQKDGRGAEQEVGRFGITPQAGFNAGGPAKAQRFRLDLPQGLQGDGPVKLNVYLVPSNGDGKGARVEIGSAEIQ